MPRPPATTAADIERVAFALFDDRGFEATTVDDIAAAVGIGRRTFFRYYASKNDVVWGDWDAAITSMRAHLEAAAPDVDLDTAITRAVVAYNRLDPDQVPLHRRRMELILHVPALQAHSTLRYAQWRDVLAAFVAARTGADSRDLRPQLAGQLALAAAITAYEQWLAHPDADLERLLTETLGLTGWSRIV